jgi:glycosyltransferase involved in cell wall biosynthesis
MCIYERDEEQMTRPSVVAFPFVGGEFGGSDISATKLITSLDRSRIAPIVFLHDAAGDMAAYLRDVGLDFVHVEGVDVLRPRQGRSRSQLAQAALSYPSAVLKLRHLLKQYQVDIVHTNNGLIHSTWAVPAALAGARLVWHHRGDPTARGVNIVAPVFADHIVTVSNFSRPSRPMLPVKKRISVIHSPFDHPPELPDRQACRMALIDELGVSKETRFFGYFGALIDRKRPLLFVKAIHAFIKANPGVPVAGLLFGPPSQYGVRMDVAVDDLARSLGIAGNIRVMGFRRPVEPFMSAVDALLVPAVNEPFGRTLIEAMMLGTPVIATNHGGNPEAISHGRTGFLVEPENPEAFVAPMTTLVTDPFEWERISSQARYEALRDYSVEFHTSRIMEIYQRLKPQAGALSP